MIIDSPFNDMERDVLALYPKGRDVAEFRSLIETMGLRIVGEYTYNPDKRSPRYYVSSGVLDGLRESIASSSIRPSGIIIYDNLKPSQIFHLESEMGVRVITRHLLVLNIFLKHAHLKEAKLQVEYALLTYQRPYVRELVRRAKMGEHPGYMAGGEYMVDDYYRLITRRLKKLRSEMEKQSIHSDMLRLRRKERGFYLVSLAGYTNAGKTSLLRAITRAKGLIIDRHMFSTLDTRTRRMGGKRILVSDTVGFIRDLPPQMINAFRATLLEIIYSDLILLVVDISEDREWIPEKVITTLDVLNDITATQPILQYKSTGARPQIFMVFNKCDLVHEPLKLARDLYPVLRTEDMVGFAVTSAWTGCGIQDLIERVESLAIGDGARLNKSS